MATRNIVKDGDPILLKKSRTVSNFDKRLHILIDDMIQTMIDANGLGLAAPQVGVLRRVIIVLDADENVIELVNPEIIHEEGEQDGPEGCLSFPGLFGMVVRPMKVVVKAQNRYGRSFEVEGEGITARAFCHEVEHLEGKVFTERVSEYIDDDEMAELRSGDELQDSDDERRPVE